MPPPRTSPAGRKWMAVRAVVFRTQGRVCVYCGHGPADGAPANQVHHILSPITHPELAYVMSNLRPCHGSPRNKCPACIARGLKGACNQAMESKSWDGKPLRAAAASANGTPVNGAVPAAISYPLSGRAQHRQSARERAAAGRAPTWPVHGSGAHAGKMCCGMPEVNRGRVISGDGCQHDHESSGPHRCW